MSDSMLQKDFKQRDVERMRNIITKKYGDKTTVQTGYVKKQEDHKEGDIWEENGRKWTLKNGIKQTVTRFDEVKKMVVMPLICPECGKPIKSSKLNKKLYGAHHKCADCVIKYETELKRQGKYEEYERNMLIEGLKTYIKELEEALLDLSINGIDESIVTERGDIETWRGGDIKEKLTQELQEYIQKLKDINNL